MAAAAVAVATASGGATATANLTASYAAVQSSLRKQFYGDLVDLRGALLNTMTMAPHRAANLYPKMQLIDSALTMLEETKAAVSNAEMAQLMNMSAKVARAVEAWRSRKPPPRVGFAGTMSVQAPGALAGGFASSPFSTLDEQQGTPSKARGYRMAAAAGAAGLDLEPLPTTGGVDRFEFLSKLVTNPASVPRADSAALLPDIDWEVPEVEPIEDLDALLTSQSSQALVQQQKAAAERATPAYNTARAASAEAFLAAVSAHADDASAAGPHHLRPGHNRLGGAGSNAGCLSPTTAQPQQAEAAAAPPGAPQSQQYFSSGRPAMPDHPASGVGPGMPSVHTFNSPPSTAPKTTSTEPVLSTRQQPQPPQQQASSNDSAGGGSAHQGSAGGTVSAGGGASVGGSAGGGASVGGSGVNAASATAMPLLPPTQPSQQQQQRHYHHLPSQHHHQQLLQQQQQQQLMQSNSVRQLPPTPFVTQALPSPQQAVVPPSPGLYGTESGVVMGFGSLIPLGTSSGYAASLVAQQQQQRHQLQQQQQQDAAAAMAKTMNPLGAGIAGMGFGFGGNSSLSYSQGSQGGSASQLSNPSGLTGMRQLGLADGTSLPLPSPVRHVNLHDGGSLPLPSPSSHPYSLPHVQQQHPHYRLQRSQAHAAAAAAGGVGLHGSAPASGCPSPLNFRTPAPTPGQEQVGRLTALQQFPHAALHAGGSGLAQLLGGGAAAAGDGSSYHAHLAQLAAAQQAAQQYLPSPRFEFSALPSPQQALPSPLQVLPSPLQPLPSPLQHQQLAGLRSSHHQLYQQQQQQQLRLQDQQQQQQLARHVSLGYSQVQGQGQGSGQGQGQGPANLVSSGGSFSGAPPLLAKTGSLGGSLTITTGTQKIVIAPAASTGRRRTATDGEEAPGNHSHPSPSRLSGRSGGSASGGSGSGGNPGFSTGSMATPLTHNKRKRA